MKINDAVFREFVKNGYAEESGKKIWDISERWFLYSTPELAKAFLNLRNFKPYKKQIVEREIALLKKSTDRLNKSLTKEPFNLIDIYCGDGKKAIEFLRALDGKVSTRYCPINVNDCLINLASDNMRKSKLNNVSEITARVSSGEGHDLGKFASKLRNKTYKRNVFLLLGSVLASYEINDYLYGLSKTMVDGDYVIIGNGIRVGDRLASLETYKHEAWNEWFINLIKNLGLSKSDIEYDARFGNKRVEMFYKLKKNKKVTHQGKEIEFRAGDEVLTAILYKYYAEELEEFCKMYFKDVEMIKDEDGEYALVICRK